MSKEHGKVVVAGVDFQAGGDEAIRSALRMLADGVVGRVHLLHVLDPRDVIDSRANPAMQTEELVLANAPTILRDRAIELCAMDDLDFQGDRVVTHVRIGVATETLLQMAVDYDADMLIVGTHGRQGIDRLVVGSVAERLVRDARCPVLVARPKDYSGLTRTELPASPLPPGQVVRERRHVDPMDHVVSTESDGWNPAHSQPTGFRIV
jgi:nucleotide-binding universal stress UspA family protein